MDAAVGACFFFSRQKSAGPYLLPRDMEIPEAACVTGASGIVFLKGSIVALIFILARCFRFLAAFYAGALVILLLAQVGQDAGLRAAAFESLQRIVQRLVLLHVNFRH